LHGNPTVATKLSLPAGGAFALLAVASLTIMVGCVIVPGLPSIATGLGLSQAASWLVTLPSLGVVLCGPLAALLISRYGLRLSLRLGLVSYGALGGLCVFLQSPTAIFLDRFLLGGATALVMAAGTGLLSEFYGGQARLTMIARQGMAIELGGVLFLALGGMLTSLGWRWPFLLYLTAWLLLVLVEMTVPTKQASAHQSQSEDATRPRLYDIYAFALMSMIVFFVAVICLPQRLLALGLSESETGYFLSLASLVAVGAAYFMPKMAARFGELGSLIAGFASYAIAHLIFATVQSSMTMIAGGILLGTGFGLTIPLLNHMTIERSHPALRGKALAYLSVAIFLGQFLSSFVNALISRGETAFLAASCLALLAIAGCLVGRLRRS